jgi:hypothetical protein
VGNKGSILGGKLRPIQRRTMLQVLKSTLPVLLNHPFHCFRRTPRRMSYTWAISCFSMVRMREKSIGPSRFLATVLVRVGPVASPDFFVSWACVTLKIAVAMGIRSIFWPHHRRATSPNARSVVVLSTNRHSRRQKSALRRNPVNFSQEPQFH